MARWKSVMALHFQRVMRSPHYRYTNSFSLLLLLPDDDLIGIFLILFSTIMIRRKGGGVKEFWHVFHPYSALFYIEIYDL